MVHGIVFIVSACLVVVSILAIASVVDSGATEEQIDSNVSYMVGIIDSNALPRIREMQENISGEDSDLNAAIGNMIDGVVSAAKGGIRLGASIGRNNSSLVMALSIPIAIYFVLFLMGVPVFSLIGCAFLVVWDRFKGRKYSRPETEQRFLK